MHAGTLDGRYRVVREIARGGMGVVYLVEHEVAGKRHAAKVLMSPVAAHAGMVERFRREARIPRLRLRGCSRPRRRERVVQRLPKMLAHVKTMTDQPFTHAQFMRPLPKERTPVWRLYTTHDYFEFDAEGTFRRRSP